jgi:hypothetical protein
MHAVHEIVSKEEMGADIIDALAVSTEKPFDCQQLSLTSKNIPEINSISFLQTVSQLLHFSTHFLCQLEDHL